MSWQPTQMLRGTMTSWGDENILAMTVAMTVHNCVNLLKTIELYLYNRWILWYVLNCTAIKMFKKRKTVTNKPVIFTFQLVIRGH